MTKDLSSRKPLAYHWPSKTYGRGVCGSHGMMAGSVDTVTCVRCKRSAHLPKRTYPLYGARP